MSSLIACPYCSENFDGRVLMESHALKAHIREIFRIDENYDFADDITCLICGERFWAVRKSGSRIARHLEECGGLVEHIIQACIFGELPLPF